MLKERLFNKWRRKNGLAEKHARHIKLANLFEPNNEKSVWNSYEAARELLSSGSRPRSILAGNDLMALGVLTAAHELGITVPGSLSIAGVDNTFISRISFPALSTIDLRMGEIGSAAAELYRRVKRGPEGNHKKPLAIPSLFCRRGTF